MAAENFRVSSGLKSIIGRELITDDFIAVFELVKNAFDAYATRVDIIFEEGDDSEPRLIIRDNGKGMSRSDLVNKWLFVAYSAKKQGTEDYRERIRSPRIFAGAKGIGRFSCDKLGRYLKVVTADKPEGSVQEVGVNWDDFEQDAESEFIDIPVEITTRRNRPPKLRTGTILEITGLREAWDRDKLIKLKRSLEKLINPNQGNDSRSFAIVLRADGQREADREVAEDEPWAVVNGRIENFLFEELKIRSTEVRVSVSDDGEYVTTELHDRGRFVYRIAEENEYDIHGIEVHLFALNQAAKNVFTRRMGVPSVQYGSVFLFKNGFRVYPFGEVGEDSWGIDRRKQQGQARFLGTRDLIGRVEINGDNSEFQEASSRDGGLIQNASVEQLREFFVAKALRRLERFAIDVIKFGNKDLPEGEFKTKVLELILQLTKSKHLIDVEYNPRIIDILQEASEASLSTLVSQFRKLADITDSPQLVRDARKAERRIRELEKAREEAETEAAKAETLRKQAEKDAETERKRATKAERKAKSAAKKTAEYQSQNLFLTSMVSADTANLVGLHHHIGIAAATIQNHIQAMSKRIRMGKPVSAEMFLTTLEKIAMQASQIEASSKFATKANFSLDAALLEDDLLNFIREYVQNVCNGVVYTVGNREMKFDWKQGPGASFTRRFRPLEIVVVLDNLISNAKKAGATKVSFTASINDETLLLSVADNGRGVSKNAASRLFELGFTTTNGSGFGLFHASAIAERLGGSLRWDESSRNGATFVWEVTR